VKSRPLHASSSPAATTLLRHEALLRRNKVVSSLGPDAVRELARVASTRAFKKGELIWRGGDPATHFQVITSGIIKLVGVHEGLRPTLIGAFGPGEAIGYWVALDGSPYIGDAIPITPQVETLLIPSSVLVRLVETQPGAALAMTHSVLAHARALRAKIALMCAGSVNQRLAQLFLDFVERFGDEAEDGTVILPVPLSRNDLALAVGATIETVIRAMSRWQKEGVVETHESGFVLRDVDTLRAVLRGERVGAREGDGPLALVC